MMMMKQEAKVAWMKHHKKTNQKIVCRKPSAKRKKAKQVRFHAAAKTHDGISVAQENLQKLVSGFCTRKPKIDLLMQLLHERKPNELKMLLFNLRDLIYRVERSPKGRAPLLGRGGGRGLTVARKNLPHLKKLFRATALVCKECMRSVAASHEVAACKVDEHVAVRKHQILCWNENQSKPSMQSQPKPINEKPCQSKTSRERIDTRAHMSSTSDTLTLQHIGASRRLQCRNVSRQLPAKPRKERERAIPYCC